MVLALLGAYQQDGSRGLQRQLRQRFGLVRRAQNKLAMGRTIRSIYGVRLACNFDDFTFRCYVNAAYGYFLWDRISTIDHPFVFLDIGANQGLYTLCAAANPHNVHSYAFEPSQDTFRFLTRNIDLNRASDKCTPLMLAVADRSGQAQLRVKTNHSGGATLADSNPVAQQGSRAIQVDTVDHQGLGALVADRETPIVVKVDVEGFEPVVLGELMKSRLAPRISEILYEVDEDWVDPTVLTELLKAHGFTRFEKQGRKTHYDVRATR